jgi:hypothetical protein
MKKNVFIFASIVTIVALSALLLILFHASTGKQPISLFPGPTPVIVNTGGESSASDSGGPGTMDEATKEALDQSYLVGKLADKLPYYGTNFNFYYSYSRNIFMLYLKPANKQAGNVEFDAFLKQNGVNNRSWIKNLVVTASPVPPPP